MFRSIFISCTNLHNHSRGGGAGECTHQLLCQWIPPEVLKTHTRGNISMSFQYNDFPVYRLVNVFVKITTALIDFGELNCKRDACSHSATFAFNYFVGDIVWFGWKLFCFTNATKWSERGTSFSILNYYIFVYYNDDCICCSTSTAATTSAWSSRWARSARASTCAAPTRTAPRTGCSM